VNLRQKLLLLLSLMVAVIVAAVAWTVLIRIRQVFEQRDQEETALFVSQFQREFQHRSAEVAAAVDRIAASERLRGMAFQLEQSADTAPFLNEAQGESQGAQLDFLEIVGPDDNRHQFRPVACAIRLPRTCGNSHATYVPESRRPARRHNRTRALCSTCRSPHRSS
jgi:hypothetical protein